ncbi:hypothetical protein F5B22DRAFT_17902 [Xylaria bambusicola]|uniref:uncharacterized protein n=1 Tax=Xylaria bambusicola TaxID=326684 RepID=UPI00200851B3|nr:uncharacterized protein F5B22DRAFT_17902 [Xylaria bambusicola]KAI0528067.1 hypothetical protein F5B22DRAFT_17902 [Xylaria bambusicola]
MPERSLLFSPAPYHVLSYGALLGTQFFHTFLNSIISFKVLQRPQFAILQRAVFPAYFGIQTVAPVVLALTYPGGAGRLAALPQGISGVLHPANRWGVLAPLTAAFVTGLANWAYFLPETNKITAQRREQEVKDGKQSWEKTTHSKDMKALNKKFAKIHGYSSLFNLVTFIATVVYGVHLSARIA